jgi:phosphatidylglycerol:prolipoprotein diacylglycerol transferase
MLSSTMPPHREWLRSTLPPRHPSQIYEALLEGVVLFTALWLLRTRARVPRGIITGCIFILYAFLRILGESFPCPDPRGISAVFPPVSACRLECS